VGSTKITNEGTIAWHQGKWDFVPTTFENRGNWLLNQMICSNSVNMTNHGVLRLEAGNLDFGHLINYKNAELEVHGGNYRFLNSFKNHNVMKLFNQDWTFTDEGESLQLFRGYSECSNENAVTLDSKVDIELGRIECKKSYTHDVQKMAEAIIVEEGVIFTKRYQQKRTLADLSKVTTPGRVIFYCPSTTVTQKSEFTFQHLELYVDGLFRVTQELLAPSLTVNVNGQLVCGIK